MIEISVPLIPPSVNQAPELFYRWSHEPKFVVQKDGCWVWTAAMHRLGYGMSNSRLDTYAHRAAYKRMVGDIADGNTLDHLCRNRACINPSHLEQVSLAENIRRSPRTKLTPDHILAIRSSDMSGAALARLLGVTRQAIFRIRHHLCWKDV